MPEARVLVVSDDEEVRAKARFSFPHDFTVSIARDAREALRLIGESKPDVVVVDLQTGSAGGYGLARDMRLDYELRAIPILVLLERPQDAWLATQAGADAHRTKPLDPAELAAATLELLPARSTS